MRRNRPALYCAILLFNSFFSTLGLQADVSATPLAVGVDDIFSDYNRIDVPGCSVAVFKDQEIVLARGYGMADLSHGVTLDSSSVFYVASVSKQFVALSILLASRQGKFSLDDDIRKYFPEIPSYGKTITIRHLLHHTSGLRDYFGLSALAGQSSANYLSMDYMLALIARQKGLNHPTGEAFSYTNSGYLLLSELIRRVSGQSLREFSAQYIFAPLGMKNTFFFDDHDEIVKNRAMGYKVKDGKISRFVTSFDLVGSGGLYSTVEDLFLYDRNFYNNKLEAGSDDLLKVFQQAGSLDNGDALNRNYGFGLRSGDYRGEFRIGHGGSSFGFKADFFRFPGKNLSTVILCNRGDSRPDQLAERIADLFLFDGKPDPAVAIEPARLQPPKVVFQAKTGQKKDVFGDYYSSEMDSVLHIDEDELQHMRARIGYGEWFAVEIVDQDMLRSQRWKIPVNRDKNGEIIALEIWTGRANGIVFERLKPEK